MTTSKKITYYNPFDVMERKYEVLSFEGEWHDFIGSPQGNFTCIVHGKPRSGKSTLIIRLAKYLADNFGPVLYNSAEEMISLTLKDKIAQSGMTKETKCRFVALRDVDQMEKAFKNSRAHFLIIDSAQKCGFTPEHLIAWQAKNKRSKRKALIIILQSEKSGQYKGSSAWGHDTDIKISVEKGTATAESRFNPPKGTYHIFTPVHKATTHATDLFNNQ